MIDIDACREGLNLMPMEYVYARKDLDFAGVVVVSEFTACSSLLSGSLKVRQALPPTGPSTAPTGPRLTEPTIR